MNCPECGEKLEAVINRHQDEEANYVEVEFACINDHIYFTRIQEDDIIEDL